jgi:hypothetical protein
MNDGIDRQYKDGVPLHNQHQWGETMTVDDFVFEKRPLSDLPTLDTGDADIDLHSWLDDFDGEEQWISDDDEGFVVQAAVVVRNCFIIWQDEPLTDDDKRVAVSEYKETVQRLRMERGEIPVED